MKALPVLVFAATALTGIELTARVGGMQAPLPPPAAANLLRDARRALGGEQAFDRVRSLQVDYARTSNPSGAVTSMAFTLLRPDRFQNRLNTITHTLAGQDFWQSRETAARVVDAARRNAERGLALWSAVFLLHPVGAVRPATPASRTIADVTGEAVEIIGKDDFTVTVLLDRHTRQPVLFATPWDQMNSSGQQLSQGVRTLKVLEYKRIGDVSFPHRLDEQIGAYRWTMEVTALVVNPAGADGLFERRPR